LAMAVNGTAALDSVFISPLPSIQSINTVHDVSAAITVMVAIVLVFISLFFTVTTIRTKKIYTSCMVMGKFISVTGVSLPLWH